MHSNHLFVYNDMHMLPYLQLVLLQSHYQKCHHIFQYSCLYNGYLQCSRVFNKSTEIVRFKLESFIYVYRTCKYFNYLEVDTTWDHECIYMLDYRYQNLDDRSFEASNSQDHYVIPVIVTAVTNNLCCKEIFGYSLGTY